MDLIEDATTLPPPGCRSQLRNVIIAHIGIVFKCNFCFPKFIVIWLLFYHKVMSNASAFSGDKGNFSGFDGRIVL